MAGRGMRCREIWGLRRREVGRQGAIIHFMEVGDARFYVERWKAVREVERWGFVAHAYHPIERILIVLGVKTANDVEKMQIILRWAKLKERYEQGKLDFKTLGND